MKLKKGVVLGAGVVVGENTELEDCVVGNFGSSLFSCCLVHILSEHLILVLVQVFVGIYKSFILTLIY